ncbi:DUF3347 domain-containing protein [Algoriphagus halophilus]|uniref:DUF3347 domain-containing protein n=1 Tax=Algoriphagus halophilus TaxID=226505 RepID=UPI00358E5805
MKNLTKTLLIAMTISLAFACKQNDQHEGNEEHMNQTEEMDHENHDAMDHSSNSGSMASVSFEDKQVSEAVNAYLALKDVLVETNGEKAKDAANELLAILENSGIEGKSEMEIEVKKIAETTDTDAQRVSFDVVSNQMIQLVKSSVLIEGKLYKQYCPMAKNNEGAFWLSVSNEIRNPYFGDKMLKCGSVEEEI